MDKIKSILSPGGKKDDEAIHDTGSGQEASRASGKLSGEGTHFGTGGTGTDSAGYSLGKNTSGHGYSAAEPTGNTDSAGYAIAKAPEAMGTREEGNHINTASTAASGPGQTDGSGHAAIGQTSVYSSHPLSTGDKISRVIDPNSSDPNTFRSPELSSSTGVAPDAAEIAARRAYDPSTESEYVPGRYPKEEASSNPYASSTLDPRVDSAGHAPVHQTHTGRDATMGVGAAAAGVGAYESSKHQDSSTSAPSTLTSTTNPTDQSAAYDSASKSRGLDSGTPATTSTVATTSTPTTTTTNDATPKKGIVGTVLGALGLGGGAAVAKHEHDKDSAVDSTLSTTTGVGSYNTPSQSGPPPSHHRKESIPTTAYPTGSLDSVRPIAGPTGQAPTEGSSSSHYGRDAAIGGGALGAAGLGAHEYEKSRELAGGVAGTSSAAPNSSSVHDIVTSGNAPTSQYTGTTSGPGTGLAATAGTTGAVAPGAASSTTTTAAGLGAHEYEKSRETTTAAPGVTPASKHYGNLPITGQGTKDFSDKVDPRTDTTGNANRGTGVGALPTTTSGQPEDQHHYGRDAAVVGGGAAAAGYGAHEISEHDAGKEEKERNKLQKSQTKEIEKEQKAHEKEIKKEQKAEEKAEKKHEKEVAKEEKKQEKLVAQEEKKHEKEGAAAVGTGAVGAGAYEAEKHHESSQIPSTTVASGATHRTHGTDPYYNRHQVPDSVVEGQQTGSNVGRDAAIGGVGAAAVGGGAYAAEKRHHDQSTTGTGHRLSGGHAAAEEREKKPGFFKRIFKRKKNPHTGESEDDEDNYEDVAHGHHHGTTTGTGSSPGSPTSPTQHQHVIGEITKPSYNPFKKEDPNVQAVEGRI